MEFKTDRVYLAFCKVNTNCKQRPTNSQLARSGGISGATQMVEAVVSIAARLIMVSQDTP